jgi:UDPglucose--hexose-1-phosphate uridylyltransferase
LEYRRDPTKGIDVIVASGRRKRPFHFGKKEGCPFCRGNEWMTTKTRFALPDGKKWVVRSFRNLYPLAKPSSKAAFGEHEVIVETNIHGKLLQDLSEEELALVLVAYQNRFRELGNRKGIKCVFLWKNHGPKAGASIEHEHAQIISLPFIPEVVANELKHFEEGKKKGKCFYCRRAEDGKTILEENKHFYAFVPAFGRSRLETWIVSKRHFGAILDFTEEEGKAFMKILAECLRRIAVHATDYIIAFHNAPLGKDFHFHAEIYPRLGIYGGLELGTGVIVNSMSEKEALRALKKRH